MSEEKKKEISRRAFLGQTSCAALGYTTLFSTLLNLKAFEAAALDNSANFPVGGTGGYKAMVCLLLGGGNDSYNMLIPRGSAEYAQYALTRSNLAIPQNQILPIVPQTFDGQEYGVHPSMPDVQQMFADNKLAFVSNVGTLIEPTTKSQFFSGSHALPLGLFSHSDQVQQWQTGRPHERTATGWGGRIADLIQTMNSNENISMNISLGGTNTFQQGQDVVEYVINSNGGVGIGGYGDGWFFNQMKTQAIDNMLDHNYADIYKDTYVNTIKKSNDANLEFQSAVDMVPDFATPFTNSYLSDQFRMVAKTIAARQTLGFDRQIFFIEYNGWDHHDEVLDSQAYMLMTVNNALSEFQATMEELGVDDCVTTFTISDFARTLTSNGNGTDHAWGGNMMVMGGAVNGGEMYGSFPSLEIGNPLDLDDGVLIPTTSADEYMTELALWFGVSGSECNSIFPNLSNFYDTNSPDQPIGFMNI